MDLSSFKFNTNINDGWITGLLHSSDEERRTRRNVAEMPVVFLPEQSDTECVAQNRMSSFGFLAFVVQSINAVVNVANNINDNNNNRNNNNNDNNNNQVNTNIANSANTQESMSMAGGMGRTVRILEMMRRARDRVWRTLSGEPIQENPPVTNSTMMTQRIREDIESRAVEMMRKLVEEKHKQDDNTETLNDETGYSPEVIEMMKKMLEQRKQRSKRESESGDFIRDLSLVVLKHLEAWEKIARLDENKSHHKIQQIYDKIDNEVEKENEMLKSFSRHLTKGGNLYIYG